MRVHLLKPSSFHFESGIEYHASHYNDEVHIHDYYERHMKDISECDSRLIVVRDPVERFLSAYTNRVKYHHELSETYLSETHPQLLKHNFSYEPEINDFIKNFDTYNQVKPIHWHT